VSPIAWTHRCAIAAVLVTLAACAQPEGTGFNDLALDEVPGGSVVVYVYRPPSVLTGSERCNMTIGDELIGALLPGQSTRVVVPAGTLRFATEGSSLAWVTARVEPASEVFIRQRWVFRLGGFQPRVDRMTRIKALAELERCVFVEEPEIFVEEGDEESPAEDQRAL